LNSLSSGVSSESAPATDRLQRKASEAIGFPAESGAINEDKSILKQDAFDNGHGAQLARRRARLNRNSQLAAGRIHWLIYSSTVATVLCTRPASTQTTSGGASNAVSTLASNNDQYAPISGGGRQILQIGGT
jgi:hypothetical protein